MKQFFILGLMFTMISFCNGQIINETQDDDYRKHQGFYLSLSAGPNFAHVNSEVVNLYNIDFKGTGAVFDLKIGGAIKEDVILHAALISKSMSGPEITSNGTSQNTSNNLSIGEAMIGGGMTYYLNPSNIFLSGTIGLGSFTLIDLDNETSVSTDRGFSMQLKVGKEWWVSKKWGLGIAVTYGKCKLVNTPGGGVEEFMDSNNFGILFNATLN